MTQVNLNIPARIVQAIVKKEAPILPKASIVNKLASFTSYSDRSVTLDSPDDAEPFGKIVAWAESEEQPNRHVRRAGKTLFTELQRIKPALNGEAEMTDEQRRLAAQREQTLTEFNPPAKNGRRKAQATSESPAPAKRSLSEVSRANLAKARAARSVKAAARRAEREAQAALPLHERMGFPSRKPALTTARHRQPVTDTKAPPANIHGVMRVETVNMLRRIDGRPDLKRSDLGMLYRDSEGRPTLVVQVQATLAAVSHGPNGWTTSTTNYPLFQEPPHAGWRIGAPD